MRAGNLLIVQGGGPTAVFNASLAGALAEAKLMPGTERIFGARAGTTGLTRGEFIDLTDMPVADLNVLRNSPGAALGSSRSQPSEDDLEQQVVQMKKMGIPKVIFMGGNGTMRGAMIVSSFCRSMQWDMQVMGVPKTVDNDIALTDRCPGFASAARYVAQSTRELGMDLRSLPQPVTILETMGRSVGWLAASATMARVEPQDAPHLVYVPEIPFQTETFLADLDNVVSRHGWAVVVVAEGIRHSDGRFVYEVTTATQQDPQKRPLTGGVSQYLADVVAENLRIRCRSEKPGLLGRASVAHVAQQDLVDAEAVGREAVRAMAAGESDKMVALLPLQRQGDARCELVPLASVAGIERSIPGEWLSGGSTAVGEGFHDYVRPLIGPLQEYCREFSFDMSLCGGSRPC